MKRQGGAGEQGETQQRIRAQAGALCGQLRLSPEGKGRTHSLRNVPLNSTVQ